MNNKKILERRVYTHTHTLCFRLFFVIKHGERPEACGSTYINNG